MQLILPPKLGAQVMRFSRSARSWQMKDKTYIKKFEINDELHSFIQILNTIIKLLIIRLELTKVLLELPNDLQIVSIVLKLFELESMHNRI